MLQGLAAGLAGGLLPGAGMRLAWADPDPRAGRALVVVFLRGGCDGLNLLVPHGEDDYHRLRPRLAIPAPGSGPGAALDLDGFFGLHPALAPLHRRYQEGSVALLPAVHLPDGSLSHFASQAAMEQAGAGDGWLGRYLAGTPAGTGALALATSPPLALRGPRPVAAYPDPFDLALAPTERGDALLARVLRDAYGTLPASGDARAPWRRAAAVLDADRTRAHAAPPAAGAYPDDPLGTGLRAAAHLLAEDPSLALVTVDMGGWDTHRAQGGAEGRQAARLDVLARGLDAFLADLGPRAGEVAVLVQTEFGRTVAENASGGTDHGRASAWLVLGGGVRGGLHLGTGWPGLAPGQLAGGRYLAGSVDYRDVYAELLASHLGARSLGATLPGHTPSPVGLFA
jgi:uncharacterized protein (DUF1501 family)